MNVIVFYEFSFIMRSYHDILYIIHTLPYFEYQNI